MQRLLKIYKFCLFASNENKDITQYYTWSKLLHKYKRVRRFVEQQNGNTVKILNSKQIHMYMLTGARKIDPLKNRSIGI